MFFELIRTVTLRSITSFAFVHAFETHSILAYGPPVQVLSNNEKQFASHFFQDASWVPNVKKLLERTYHPQTNRHAEPLDQPLLISLRA